MKFVSKLTSAFVAATLVLPPLSAQSTTAKEPAKTATKTPSKTAAPVTKSAAGKTTAVKSAQASASAKAKGKAKPASPRQWVQNQPTPERYKEIQQALADKGYFHGTVDGTWGPESADALKRFQTDQNLDADGKLSALSLIALGLGPRHGAAKPGEETAHAPEAPVNSETNPPPVAEPPQPQQPPQDPN